MQYTEGKFTSSIAYRDSSVHATRISTLGEVGTAEEAYTAAWTALRAHDYADRLHISRGELDSYTGAVNSVFVAEWDINRESGAVVASNVDKDIPDFPALRAAYAPDEVLPGLALRPFEAERGWVLVHVRSVGFRMRDGQALEVYFGGVFLSRHRALRAALDCFAPFDWTRSRSEVMSDVTLGATANVAKWRENALVSPRSRFVAVQLERAEAAFTALT